MRRLPGSSPLFWPWTGVGLLSGWMAGGAAAAGDQPTREPASTTPQTEATAARRPEDGRRGTPAIQPPTGPPGASSTPDATPKMARPVRGAGRLYLEVAKRGFRRYSTYRAATVAGVFTNSVVAFIRAYILIALFRQRGHIGGFDERDALTFTFVSQGFLMPMAMFGWYEIEQRVRTGDIVSDLYRPVDFQGYWMALDGGRALYQAIGRGVPPVLVGAVFFSLRAPPAAALPIFAVSCLLGLAVSFALRFLTNLLSFWMIDIRGPAQVLVMVELFLGGVVLPIALFPRTLEVLARAPPFASTAPLPLEAQRGEPPGAAAPPALAARAASGRA